MSRIDISYCPKHKYQKMTLLFNGYICDICNPAKIPPIPAVKSGPRWLHWLFGVMRMPTGNIDIDTWYVRSHCNGAHPVASYDEVKFADIVVFLCPVDCVYIHKSRYSISGGIYCPTASDWATMKAQSLTYSPSPVQTESAILLHQFYGLPIVSWWVKPQ